MQNTSGLYFPGQAHITVVLYFQLMDVLPRLFSRPDRLAGRHPINEVFAPGYAVSPVHIPDNHSLAGAGLAAR